MIKTWLFVLLILGVLAYGLLVPARTQALPAMQTKGTEQFICSWRSAILAYKKDQGRMPPRGTPTILANGLIRANPLRKNYFLESTYERPYVFRNHALDAWGVPLVFDWSTDGNDVMIKSSGPDMHFGTKDDITSATARDRNLRLPVEFLSASSQKKAAGGEPKESQGDDADPQDLNKDK